MGASPPSPFAHVELWHAAFYGDVAKVRRLLKGGADVNFVHNGVTPLFVAAQNNHTAVIKLLLENKAEVDMANNNDGSTPLSIAAENGRTDAMKLLLKHKAMIDKARDDGRTPLYIAAARGRTESMQFLLKHKATVDEAANDGATPLFIAAANSHADAMQLLLRHGAQANLVRADGYTAMLLAAERGHAEAVKLLLPHMTMAAVNQQTKEHGFTALHQAAGCNDGHPAVIELLVCHGADMAIKTNYGIMALQYARHFKLPLCARILDPHDLLPLLLPWSVERSRGIHDGAVVRTSTNDDGTTTVHRARLTYPPPFNLAALTLFRQVSPHCTPAIAPNPVRGVLGIGRMAGLPTCPVRDPVTQEVRDVDLLQEHIFASGMLDLDWFTQDPARRLRTWLPAPQRLALRRWEVGDRVEVCGLVSASELNGRMAVVKAYLPKQRRFECVLDEEEEGKDTKAAGKMKGGKKRKKKKKVKKPKPVALRAENLVVRHCKACGKARGATKLLACGGCKLVHYCEKSCQKKAWRAHKSFCNFARKETEKAKVEAAAKAAAALAAAKAKAKAAKASAAAPGSGGAGVGAGRGCSGRTSDVSAHSENRRQGGATDPSLGRPTWVPRRRARLHMSSAGMQHFMATSRTCGGCSRAGPTSTLSTKGALLFSSRLRTTTRL